MKYLGNKGIKKIFSLFDGRYLKRELLWSGNSNDGPIVLNKSANKYNFLLFFNGFQASHIAPSYNKWSCVSFIYPANVNDIYMDTLFINIDDNIITVTDVRRCVFNSGNAMIYQEYAEPITLVYGL